MFRNKYRNDGSNKDNKNCIWTAGKKENKNSRIN